MQEKNENITKIIVKLLQYINYKDITYSQIAIKIGLSNSYFSKMLKNKGSLGEDIIRKILLYYDDINPSWLLIDEGPMLKNKHGLTSDICEKCATKDNIILLQQKLIDSLEENLAHLRQKYGVTVDTQLKKQKKVV